MGRQGTQESILHLCYYMTTGFHRYSYSNLQIFIFPESTHEPCIITSDIQIVITTTTTYSISTCGEGWFVGPLETKAGGGPGGRDYKLESIRRLRSIPFYEYGKVQSPTNKTLVDWGSLRQSRGGPVQTHGTRDDYSTTQYGPVVPSGSPSRRKGSSPYLNAERS